MKYILLIPVLFLSSTAFAGTDLDKKAYELSLSSGSIAEQRKIIEAKISQIEYVELNNEDRNSLFSNLDSLEKTAASGPTAFAQQKAVNDILDKAFSDSKLVCKYESPLGSNMKKRTCMTLAAKNRVFEKTQHELQSSSGVKRTF